MELPPELKTGPKVLRRWLNQMREVVRRGRVLADGAMGWTDTGDGLDPPGSSSVARLKLHPWQITTSEDAGDFTFAVNADESLVFVQTKGTLSANSFTDDSVSVATNYVYLRVTYSEDASNVSSILSQGEDDLTVVTSVDFGAETTGTGTAVEADGESTFDAYLIYPSVVDVKVSTTEPDPWDGTYENIILGTVALNAEDEITITQYVKENIYLSPIFGHLGSGEGLDEMLTSGEGS